MADRRESSLLFSLDSLLAHERDKVARERHAAEVQKRAALEAALAAERARKAEAERRAAQEREHALAEERRAREETARLVAIREAEIERIRLEAARQSERELAARRERHELELRAVSEQARVKKLRIAAVAATLAGVVGAGFVTLAVVGRHPFAAELRAASDSVRAADARVAELMGLLNDVERRRRGLEAELAARQRESPRETPTAVPNTPAVRPVRPALPPPHAGKHVPPPCGGDAHDPLNPCLGG